MVDLRSLKNDPNREKGTTEMERKCWFTDCKRTDPGSMLKSRVTNEVYQICPDHVTEMNEILEDDGNSIHPTYFDWDHFVDLYGDGEFYAETRFEPTPMGYKAGSNLRSLYVLLYNSVGDPDVVELLRNDDGSPAIFPYPEEAFEAGYGRLRPGVAEFQAVELNPKMVTIEPKV